MLRVVEDSFRWCAYDSNGQTLHVYEFYDYEDRMVLASRHKLTEDELKKAISEAWDDERLNRKKASKLYKELEEGFLDEQQVNDLVKQIDTEHARDLETFLRRKFDLHPFSLEGRTWQRPEDWGKRHNEEMKEEMEDDE